MAGRAAPVLAALTAWLPALVTAQVATNRAALYLDPTAVADARALWVNPAGLAVLYNATVHLDVTVREPGARGRLRQITAGFGSRGLGFSYQRDRFARDSVAHTYRLGLAAGTGGLAGGIVWAYYRGIGAKAAGWDVGVVYALHAAVTVGGVVANIGEPDVRGVELPLTFVPAVTVAAREFSGSAHARLTGDSVLGYAFTVRWNARTPAPLGLVARLDTDGGMRRAAFAFGLSVGIRDLVGAVLTTSGDVRSVDAASLYGVVTRPLEAR